MVNQDSVPRGLRTPAEDLITRNNWRSGSTDFAGDDGWIVAVGLMELMGNLEPIAVAHKKTRPPKGGRVGSAIPSLSG